MKRLCLAKVSVIPAVALALFLLVSPAHAQDDQSLGMQTVIGQPATDESSYEPSPGDYNPGWVTATVYNRNGGGNRRQAFYQTFGTL